MGIKNQVFVPLIALFVAIQSGVCAGKFCAKSGPVYCTNDRPVVGILSQDLDESNYPASSNYIASSYVKYVEMFAAQVVPILPNRPEEYYDYLLTRLNGVLLPGGDVSLYSGSYYDFAQKAFDYSEKVFNESGEIFPILGICLGKSSAVNLTFKLGSRQSICIWFSYWQTWYTLESLKIECQINGLKNP